MKHLLSSLSLLILVSVLMPSKAYSIDITGGATAWFAGFQQPYTKNVTENPDYNNTKNALNVLYGPVLSVKFNDDFNLTFVFLYGKCDAHEISDPIGANIDYSFKRTDVDLALNYRLNDYFKIFAGVKYIGFSMDDNKNVIVDEGVVFNVYRNAVGPGLGLSAVYPILENIFFVGNLSGFYLWGQEKKGYYDAGINRTNVKTNCNDYGMNVTLSLAYYIAPISTTISLGARGQFVKTNYDSAYNVHRYGQGDGYDTSSFYGITLTATYSFSI